MNKDINLIFEAYKRKILVNEADIGADYGPFLGAVQKGVKERSGDTYIFSKLAKATGKTPEEVVEMIIEPLYKALFPEGKFVVDGESKDQLAKLQNAVQEHLKQSYPGAISGYTARIIKNFIAPVVKIINDEPESTEDVSPEEAKSVVTKAVKQAVTDGDVPDTEPAAPASDEVSQSADRTTVRVEQMIAQLVDDSGVLETGVIKDVSQQILDSGGLGIEESKITGKVKAVLNNLVKKQVFERKGQYVKLGKNYEKFEQGGDLGSEALSDEDIISRVTGLGERPTTARSTWGGHGDSMFG